MGNGCDPEPCSLVSALFSEDFFVLHEVFGLSAPKILHLSYNASQPIEVWLDCSCNMTFLVLNSTSLTNSYALTPGSYDLQFANPGSATVQLSWTADLESA